MKRRMPPLNAIRAFEAAARLQSISGAAEELSVTPTAISHQIRHLETLLDVKLFQRSGRNIELTAQGARMLPEISVGMNHLASAFEEVYGNIDKSTINLTTTREYARYWLQPRLASFYEQFPDLTLNVYASEGCADLQSSEVDIAIRYGPWPSETSKDILLFQEFYVGTSSRALLQDPEVSRKISDVQAKRLIDVRWERPELIAPTWKIWFKMSKENNYADYIKMSFDAYNLAFDALKRGHGTALLSRTIVESSEFDSDLVRLDGPQLPGYYYRAICTAAGRRKKAVGQFLDWLILENENAT